MICIEFVKTNKKYDRENQIFCLEYNLSEIPMGNLIRDVINQGQFPVGPYVKYGPLCVFVSKTLLEHRQSYLFTYCLCLLLCYLNGITFKVSLQGLKYFLYGLYRKSMLTLLYIFFLWLIPNTNYSVWHFIDAQYV